MRFIYKSFRDFVCPLLSGGGNIITDHDLSFSSSNVGFCSKINGVWQFADIRTPYQAFTYEGELYWMDRMLVVPVGGQCWRYADAQLRLPNINAQRAPFDLWGVQHIEIEAPSAEEWDVGDSIYIRWDETEEVYYYSNSSGSLGEYAERIGFSVGQKLFTETTVSIQVINQNYDRRLDNTLPPYVIHLSQIPASFGYLGPMDVCTFREDNTVNDPSPGKMTKHFVRYHPIYASAWSGKQTPQSAGFREPEAAPHCPPFTVIDFGNRHPGLGDLYVTYVPKFASRLDPWPHYKAIHDDEAGQQTKYDISQAPQPRKSTSANNTIQVQVEQGRVDVDTPHLGGFSSPQGASYMPMGMADYQDGGLIYIVVADLGAEGVVLQWKLFVKGSEVLNGDLPPISIYTNPDDGLTFGSTWMSFTQAMWEALEGEKWFNVEIWQDGSYKIFNQGMFTENGSVPCPVWSQKIGGSGLSYSLKGRWFGQEVRNPVLSSFISNWPASLEIVDVGNNTITAYCYDLSHYPDGLSEDAANDGTQSWTGNAVVVAVDDRGYWYNDSSLESYWDQHMRSSHVLSKLESPELTPFPNGSLNIKYDPDKQTSITVMIIVSWVVIVGQKPFQPPTGWTQRFQRRYVKTITVSEE